jgi:hypothetical protein
MFARLLPALAPPSLLAAALVAAGCGGGGSAASPTTQGQATVPSVPAPSGSGSPPTSTNGKGAPGKPSSGTTSGGTAKGRPRGKAISPGAPSYIGTFTTEVSTAEARRFGKGFTTPGRWTLILGKGTYNLSSPKRATSGTLTVARSRMVFAPAAKVKLPKALQGAKAKTGSARTSAAATELCRRDRGRYSWSLRGSTLEFDVKTDSCAARRVLLAKRWTQRQ